MRRLQIGIIGSCSDLSYSGAAERFAKELGRQIAEGGYTLVFGAEKDIDSLPTIAAIAAREAGGETLAITYETGLDIYRPESASAVVASGLVRGGGRETTLMLSCDAAIAIAGGSGTLNEICVAYQANIPIIVVDTFGGWGERLSGEFLDARKRYKFTCARTPAKAIELTQKLIRP